VSDVNYKRKGIKSQLKYKSSAVKLMQYGKEQDHQNKHGNDTRQRF
jgi:hypothetical protein